MGATPEEIAFVKRHMDDGLEDGEITEKLWQDIENMRFRKQTDQISKENTQQFINKLKQVATQIKKPYNTIFRFLVGDKSGITSRSLARAHARFGFFSAKMRMPNKEIKAKLQEPGFVSDLLKEMDNFDGKPKTANKLAFELADSITMYQKKQLAELNSFGGGVFWRDDYITKQWHDAYRMLKAGDDKWVHDIMKYLDHDETKSRIRFNIINSGKQWNEKKYDLRKYLKKVFHETTSESSNEGLILDSIQMKRTFKFKDTDALGEYNKLYGHENMGLAIFENMSMMDNHIAFGEAWGFGYREKLKLDDATLQPYLDELADAKKSGDADLIADAQANLNNVQWKQVNPVQELKNTLYLLKESGQITKPQFRRLRGALSQVTGDS